MVFSFIWFILLCSDWDGYRVSSFHFLFPRLELTSGVGIYLHFYCYDVCVLSLHFFVYDVSQIPAGLRVS